MAKIVVGVDGSDGSKRALRWAVEEARLRALPVQAVHAWHVPYADLSPFVPVVDPEIFHEAGRQALDDVVASVDGSGLEHPIERVVAYGPAVTVLTDAAEGADLLVVGARGLGGFTGLLLGSVSQHVAKHRGCPVVIVPPER
jgi:nucleotide-binding universal stress UspA family protein